MTTNQQETPAATGARENPSDQSLAYRPEHAIAVSAMCPEHRTQALRHGARLAAGTLARQEKRIASAHRAIGALSGRASRCGGCRTWGDR